MEDLVLKDKHLLVVDDEVDLREIVASELEYMGANVFQAENVASAQKILEKHHIDLVISDIRMPGGTGIDLLIYVKNQNLSHPPVILITGFADISLEDAYNLGAEALISKPFRLEELVTVSQKLMCPPAKRYAASETPGRAKPFELTFKEALNSKIGERQIRIGRGGLCVLVELQNFQWELQDRVSFQLQFEDVSLTGTGVLKWWKPVDQISKAIVGLEFESLDAATFQTLEKYWLEHKPKPYIPSL